MSKSSHTSALDKVTMYLSKRDYSAYELEQKLKRADYSAEEIQEAIEVAIERKWLLPPEELAKKVMGVLERKGKSKAYIKMYLKKLRLPLVSPDEDNEVDKAMQLVERRLRLKPPYSFEQKKKVLQFLRNRFYDEACIRKVIHHEVSRD